MDKQNVVNPYNGILFGSNKEWSVDTCYNINEPYKHVKKKKSDTKATYSIYMKYLEKAQL